MRTCGGCTLCCKLLPMQARGDSELEESIRERAPWILPGFDKPANTRCEFQSRKGCECYSRRPVTCRVFSCRWLTNADTASMSRPDRARYVIDPMPDFVVLVDNATGERRNVECVQVWCDPQQPNAWQDPRLLDFIERRAAEGKLALVRLGSYKAITVFAPSMSPTGQWAQHSGESIKRTHTIDEILDVVHSLHKPHEPEHDQGNDDRKHN